MVPDHQIHALCAIVDTDFSGTVDIEETRFPKRGVDVDEWRFGRALSPRCHKVQSKDGMNLGVASFD